MHRTISPLALLFISVSAIIGSGWLFGSMHAAKNAGPASILSWIIAGGCVCIIAFTYAEICSMVPVSASSVRLPQFTHGRIVAIFVSLITWLSYVTLTVIEALAVIHYLSFYIPAITNKVAGGLTVGYILACILLFILSFINTYSVKLITKCNSLLTIIKIFIPLFVCLILLASFFSISNVTHPAQSVFAPFGIHGIFAAISVGGVIFSYNGFKQAAEMAGEAKNPSFSVPFAIVGSVVLCMGIFLILQSSFLCSLSPEHLKNGWHSLTLTNNDSPFVSILFERGKNWVIPVLYFGAIISPMAAGLVYCTGAARSLSGIAANGYVSKIFLKLNKREESYISVWTNFVVAAIIFNFFRDWNQVANLLTVLFAISYGLAPVCMVALRNKLPLEKRPIKLPFGYVWAYLAFFFSTMFVYWCGWTVISTVGWVFIVSFVLTITYQIVAKKTFKKLINHWKASIWMWAYFIVIIASSYMGSYGEGHAVWSDEANMIFIAISSGVVLFLSGKYSLRAGVMKHEILRNTNPTKYK